MVTKGNLSGLRLTPEDLPGITLGEYPSGLNVPGRVSASGYIIIKVKGRAIRSHRAVYALAYGECPAGAIVDHIDRNKQNNSPENLRLVDARESSLNRDMPKVFRNKRKGSVGRGIWRHGDKFRVVVRKTTYGIFDTEEEAIACREAIKEV